MIMNYIKKILTNGTEIYDKSKIEEIIKIKKKT
jgi:hypothetical protein